MKGRKSCLPQRLISGKKQKKDILNLSFCALVLVFVHMHGWVWVEVCVCICIYVCMFVVLFMGVRVRVYMCVRLHVCVCMHVCTHIIHMKNGWYLHFSLKHYFNYDITIYKGFLWILPCFLISALGILTTARMKLYLGALAVSNQLWLPFPRGLERFVRL